MSGKFIIYGLYDTRPGREGQIRYVGQTAQGLERPKAHWMRARLRERKDKCHTWIRAILREGLVPEVRVIQELEREDQLNSTEIYHIAKYREAGCALTNMTLGGEGTRGLPSPTKGKKLSSEHRQKIGAALKGKPTWIKGKTKATHPGIAKQAQAISGGSNWTQQRPFSQEHREKIGAASKLRIPWNKKRGDV